MCVRDGMSYDLCVNCNTTCSSCFLHGVDSTAKTCVFCKSTFIMPVLQLFPFKHFKKSINSYFPNNGLTKICRGTLWLSLKPMDTSFAHKNTPSSRTSNWYRSVLSSVFPEVLIGWSIGWGTLEQKMIQYSVTLLNRNTLETLLVGGLEHMYTFVIFRYIRNVIIPTDFHIFQRGRSVNHQPDYCGRIYFLFFFGSLYIYNTPLCSSLQGIQDWPCIWVQIWARKYCDEEFNFSCIPNCGEFIRVSTVLHNMEFCEVM